ncbi:unnamed protein product [Trichobilharzia regenti]|nr:unnamed protein product [Trichobilharzia regenti]
MPCHGFKIEFTDTYSSSTALNLTNSKDRNNLTLVKSTLPSVNYKNDLKGMATSKIDIVSNGNQQTPVESLPSIKDKTVQIQKNCTDKLTPVDEEFQKLSITVQQNQQLLEQHSKSDNYRNLSNAHLSTDLNKADDDDDNDNSNNKKDELMAELNNATKVVEVEMLVKDKPVQKQSQNCMSKKTPHLNIMSNQQVDAGKATSVLTLSGKNLATLTSSQALLSRYTFEECQKNGDGRSKAIWALSTDKVPLHAHTRVALVCPDTTSALPQSSTETALAIPGGQDTTPASTVGQCETQQT